MDAEGPLLLPGPTAGMAALLLPVAIRFYRKDCRTSSRGGLFYVQCLAMPIRWPVVLRLGDGQDFQLAITRADDVADTFSHQCGGDGRGMRYRPS